MRTIQTKYAGECRKCSAALAVGDSVVYERRVGIFCPGCAPTDPEEIREYRQEGADRKADRLDGWAQKREEKAAATLNSNPTVRHDWAFITQPGHIPERARMNRADDRACESLRKARQMRGRAAGIRQVRVAGDAEKNRQAERDLVKPWLRVGQKVTTAFYGEGKVKRINKKTATICETGSSKTFTVVVDLSWIAPLGD